MAHGEGHAKETVLLQADGLEDKLQNGHGADLATHGAALLLLLQMIKPIFKARFVTEEECLARIEACPARNARRGVTWPLSFGFVCAFAALCLTMLRILGKI